MPLNAYPVWSSSRQKQSAGGRPAVREPDGV